MKVALYARVSSEKQAEKDLSIPAQLKGMTDYALKKGWEISREFVDEAKSARTANRPQFQEMIATAKQKDKPFTAILVWKLSRFARNREDSIIYKSLLRKIGVEVISINEVIEDSPSGKLFEGMIEVMDEFYSANLSQDTIRGMKENARRGFLNGGAIPYGYIKIKVKDESNQRSRLDLDETHAPTVKKMFDLCLQGFGAKEISKKLNAEGHRTRQGKKLETNAIHYILRNETYTGTLIFNRAHKNSVKAVERSEDETIRIENVHPAIIDKKTFMLAQLLIEKRSPKTIHPRTLTSNYIFSGFLFCPECGSNMVGASAKGGRFFYYACRNHMRRGTEGCNQKSVNKQKFETMILDTLKIRVLTEKNLSEVVTMINQSLLVAKRDISKLLKEKDSEISQAQEKLQNLYEVLESDKLDLEDIAPRIKKVRADIKLLEAEKAKIESEEEEQGLQISPSEIGLYVQDLKALLEEGSFMERKGFLKSFIKRIEYSEDKGGLIEYTFPLIEKNANEKASFEVLSFNQNGGVDGARTRDLLRDRQAL
jgi:site-specific DNA recombinase